MSRIFLQSMIEAIPDDRLPASWRGLDFDSFSPKKRLWDYQQKALKNAIKLLWRHYSFADHNQGEWETNLRRKKELWQWYKDNGLRDGLDIELRKLDHHLKSLLREYYPEIDSKIAYEHFINRACFWMATGSGKTLVIVKLIELLWHLMKRDLIPFHDILILTHRDDLIEQLKRHVGEFNQGGREPYIRLRELREYASAKREASLFREQEAIVFYYRSDNLSDEQKEKLVDFRNYDNGGHWYVLLDEAHKGDKEDSKRQHIYSILSRNGFLFNFSATFTDPRDIVTTVFNFNLSEYIGAGYGKHIAILKQEFRAFRNGEDYTGKEKQKVVLKALLMLAYVCMVYETVKNIQESYHKPLLLVLVNSVNTEDADLYLFFQELERIGRGEVSEELWKEAVNELLQELKGHPQFMFEEECVKTDEEVLKGLKWENLLRWVFNSESEGEIEILVRPSDRKEMAFKLKTADRPFALIRIGDISGWLKNKLQGYELNERFEDESYFIKLNQDDSDINILMGSRTFYEGWDSNRPNIICYINIGVGEDARKFILQSIGRGARIEPLRGKRKRLRFLYNAGEVPQELFDKLKNQVQPMETLFVFGTNREALKTVLETLSQEQTKTGVRQLSLFEINPEVEEKSLLVPVYRLAQKPLAERRSLTKFSLNQDDYELLKRFVSTINDQVLLVLFETTPDSLKLLRQSLTYKDKFYELDGQKLGEVLALTRRVLGYLSVMPEELERLKELKEEIRHFRHISVTLEDIKVLHERVEKVKGYRDHSILKAQLKEKLSKGEIGIDEYTEEIERVARMVKEESFDYDGKSIKIKHIAHHYYLPLVLAESEMVDYIMHIIKTRNEVRFIRQLENYLSHPSNLFKEFDWWMFSKLDESLDEVYIPYYNPFENRISRFYPDFVFWLKRGNDYFIVFTDPKGTEYRDPDRKLEGYQMVFEDADGQPYVLRHKGVDVRVFCFLWTEDKSTLAGGNERYWIESTQEMLKRVLAQKPNEINKPARVVL